MSALGSIGLAQWRVLRCFVPNTDWWVPATAAAWLAGRSLVFGSMAFIQEGDSSGRVAMIGGVAGLLMGAVAAGGSGLALV